MERRLLLDVVVGKSTTILQLLSSKDKPLLIRGNSFLVLNFGFDILNAVRWFNFQRNGLASQGLDENLHSSPQTENEMECRLLLDVVVGKSATILQLLSSKDKPLLIRGNSFLVLN